MFDLYRPFKFFTFLILAILLSGSCTVVKNYPVNTPFVYQNIINLKGEVSKDEKKRLQLELANYWDDSLKVNSILTYGFRTVIKKPPVYDSSAISRSILFMNSYLNNQGYYNVEFANPPTKFITKKDQVRAIVAVDINLNKNLRIDSVSYDSITNMQLRELALASRDKSLLTKNSAFNNTVISNELDRLVQLFKDSGFYKFSRENIYAEVDTTNLALLEITLDPFEQAGKIAEVAEQRRNNPTINVSIRQRAGTDSNAFTRYRIGWINFYPETRAYDNIDSLIGANFPKVQSEGHFTVKQYTPIIRMAPLRQHSYMRQYGYYNDQSYYKTINALSNLGPWNQFDSRIIPRADSPQVLDFHFFLTPAPKYSFGYDLEVSRNSGSIISGNLLGISNVLTLRNRNVWKQAIQASTIIRAGVELGFTDTVLQTFQASISQTFSIPRFLTPWTIKNLKRLDDYKTVLNFNGSYTDRRNFFRLRSGVAGFGYEWKKKNKVWLYRPLNIELYSLDTLQGLRAAFITNPFLRTAFNTGYVVSQTATFSIGWPSKRHPNVLNNFRISGEEAGGLMGRLRGLRNKIYQYLKFESEFTQVHQWQKTALAYRFFGGIGINYSNDPVLGKSLPFFKQFVAGGPYSMRAWGVRQLGLGSSLLSDTSSVFRDRFGDIQLEGNIEYRFPITSIGSMKINSAFFVDIGNIWNLKNDVANPNSRLALNRLYNDLAIAAGIGLLRLDFSYFLIRLDFAYKVKDPARLSNNGWMSIKDFEWENHEFEKKDANGNGFTRKNFSFQLGIGLPF